MEGSHLSEQLASTIIKGISYTKRSNAANIWEKY